MNELTREITVSRSLDRTNALTETKGWERRVIPISDRLWAGLRAVDDRTKRHVLAHPLADRPLRYDGVRDAILAVYARAKVTPPPLIGRDLHPLDDASVFLRGVRSSFPTDQPFLVAPAVSPSGTRNPSGRRNARRP